MARRAGIGRQFKKGAKDPRVLASVVQRTAERQAAGPPRGPPTVDPSERKRTRKSTKKAAAVDGRRRMRVSETDERTAIKVVFDMLGRPPEAEWDGRGGTATRIMQGLNLNGSPRKVKRTLAAIQEGGTDWDPSAGSARGGRKKKLGQLDCEIGADQLAQGLGLGQTLHNVNDMLRKAGKSEVCKTTLRDNVKVQIEAVRQRTCKRPTGGKEWMDKAQQLSDDEE